MLIKSIFLLTCLSLAQAKGNYWWMNDPGSVFGPGGSGSSNNGIKKQQQFDSFPAKVQQKPVQNQNNIGYPAPQPSKLTLNFRALIPQMNR